MTCFSKSVMIGGKKVPLKRCADVMDLTYGGRVTAPPHNHGVRARRTSKVYAFWMVLEGSPQALPLTVFLSDGITEAMALFSGEEEARMFCHFSQKWASANIRQTTASEVISLLYCPWCAAKHVALDPFSEILADRLLLGLLTLDREDFAPTLRGLGLRASRSSAVECTGRAPLSSEPFHALGCIEGSGGL